MKAQDIIYKLKKIVGKSHIITNKLLKEPFTKGWRYGKGEAIACETITSVIKYD